MKTTQNSHTHPVKSNGKSWCFRAALLTAVSLISVGAQTVYQWNTTATPNSWNSSANWTPSSGPGTTIPGLADTAAFTNLDITAATTVTLDNNQTVNKIIFGDTVTNTAFGWVVSAGTPSTSTLTVAGANPTIQVNALGGASIANITAPILATNLTIVGPGVFNLGSLSSVISGLFITNGGTFEFGSGANPNFFPLTFSGNGTFSSGLSSSYSVGLNIITNMPGVISTITVGGRSQLGATNGPSNIGGTLTINVGAQVSGPSRDYMAGTWENTFGTPSTINFVGTTTTSYVSPTFTGSGGNTAFNSLLTNATFNLSSTSAGVNKIYINPANNSGGNTFNMGALSGTGDGILTSSGTGPGTTYSVGMLGTSTTYGGQFQGDCSLTKIGSGTLTLTNNSIIGANSANAVNVNAGKLVGVTGGSFIAPAFNVANGATNGVQVATTGGQWITTNLVYATGTNYLEFNFGTSTASSTVAPLLTTNLTINSSASNVVSVLGGVWTPGTYPLIKYTGTFGGSGGYAAMRLGALPLRVVATLNNNTANHSIDLVVSAVNEPLKWAASSGTWDIGTSANWKDAAANVTTYQEQLGLGDQVVLEDNVSGASPITVTLNSTVTPSGFTVTNSSKNYTISGNGNIQGAVPLNKQGSGTLTLTTTNTFTGAVNLNGGILNFTGLNNLGNGTAINFGGGTLQYESGNSADISARTVTINSGGATIDTAGNNVTFTKRIGNGGAGSLVKTGAGTLTLNTNSTFSGVTFINQGTLLLGTSLSNSAALVVGAGATLDASTTGYGLNLNGAIAQVLAGSGTVTGVVTTASGTTLTAGTNGVAGTLTFGNDLNLNGGTYVFDVGTASRDLLSVAGALSVNGGTLAINPLNTLTNGTYKLIQYAGGYGGSVNNLTLSGGQANKIFALSDATSGEIDLLVSSSGTNNLTWTGDGSQNFWDTDNSLNWYDNYLHVPLQPFDNGDTVTFDDSYFNSGSESPAVNIENGPVAPAAVTVITTNTYTFAGSKITGGGTTLTKNGTGTLVLATVANDYGGGTVIANGSLQIGDGSTGGTAIGGGPVTNNAALVFYQPDNSSVIGNIAGTGSLYQQGANSSATLTLLGNNSYSGLTTVDTGSLQVGNGGLTGTLGTNAVLLTNASTLVINRAGTLTLANGISGNGALTFAGGGTVTLAGVNIYSNNTTIANGTVKLGSNNAIASGPATTGWLILDGAATAAGTLDLNGHNQAVNDLSGLAGAVLGQIVNNGGTGLNTLTIGTANTTTYAGLIEDNNNAGGGKIGLEVDGDGSLSTALTLSGTNSYSGPVLINGAWVKLGGTLATVGDAAIGTGLITLTNGGELQMNGLGSQTPTTTFVNAIVVPAGTTGSLLTGGRTVYSGNITVHGTLNLTTSYVRSTPTGDFSASDGQINILPGTGGGQVYFNTVGNISFGTAAVYLASGANIYNHGNTPVGGNTITMGELTGGGTISDTDAGVAGRTTTYVVGGRNTSVSFQGSIVNGTRNTGINKVGTGSWELDGTDSYSGNTTVSGGSLIVGSSGFMSASPLITINVGALLDVSAYGGLTLGSAQTLAGGGGVVGSVTAVAGDIISPGVGTVAGTLSFSNSLTETGANVTNNFNLSSDPTGVSKTNSLVVVNGDLTLTGTNVVIINPLNTILGAGTYTLFTYTGNLNNEGGVVSSGTTLPGNLVAGGAFAANADVTLTFSNAVGAVVMIVTPNGQNLAWQGGITGTATNNWDVNISSNWVNSGTVTNFLQYDNVTFNDSSTNLNAIVAGTVAPGSITVSSTNGYTFSGTGKITGGTGLTKSGTNVLTISNSGGNDFTGNVTINAGTLKVGVATALGATNGITIITNTGALDVGGFSLGAEPITVSGAGSGSGAILNSGAASLNALQFVTLAGDTTFGGTNRWDIRTNALGAYLNGNSHNLTKVSTNDVYLVSVGNASLGNIQIQQGRIGVQDNTLLGAGGTLTLSAGAGLDFYDNNGVTNTKPVVLTNATISSTSSTNVLGSTIALNGTGTFTATTPLVLNGALGGTGGLVKNGAAALTLTATNNYSGSTTISNGVLALAATASITNSSVIDITAGATLDASAKPGGTLTLGSSQTLQGAGTVVGSVNAPAGSTVSPGESGIGTLTVTNALTLAGSTIMEINRNGGSPVNDQIVATNIQYGGTLTVNNLGAAPQANDTFKLFSGSYASAFATVSLPALGVGLAWSNSLAINGYIAVIAVQTVNTNPYPAITNSIVSGNQLALNWGAYYLGWRLQVQTNNLATGISNNWVTVPGSTNLTGITNTIDLGQPTVFYRLVYP